MQGGKHFRKLQFYFQIRTIDKKLILYNNNNVMEQYYISLKLLKNLSFEFPKRNAIFVKNCIYLGLYKNNFLSEVKYIFGNRSAIF